MNQSYRPSAEFEELLDAMCDGDLSADQSRRLEEIAAGNDDDLLHYLCAVHLHGTLHWNIAQPARAGNVSSGEPGHQLPTDDSRCSPDCEPVAPLIILDLTPPGHSRFDASLQSFIAGPIFSYLVAGFILAAMIFGASLYKVARHGQIAGAAATGSDVKNHEQMTFVGLVTNMKDCRWSDPATATIVGASVPLNRKYALASGLLQITYNTGAKVVLEGPCAYEADARDGGYLELGRLTARVKKNDELGIRNKELKGQEPDVHHSSFIAHHLFSVRTPTAVVTDLGTEFGVEVDDGGNCTAHVFKGRVEVKPRDPKQAYRAVELSAGDSARAEYGDGRFVAIHRGAASPERFSRSVPHRGPICVFNTGRRVRHDTPDPHWRITAATNFPGFTPQQAVVTLVSSKYFRRNMPLTSQWISTADELPELPEGVTFTFQTAFELNGSPPESLELKGSFAADNHVDAIRINGRPVAVPEHGHDQPFIDMCPFSIKTGFVEGTNVIEFDVRNGIPGTTQRPSIMALLVEMEAVVDAGHNAENDPIEQQKPAITGKEGAR